MGFSPPFFLVLRSANSTQSSLIPRLGTFPQHTHTLTLTPFPSSLCVVVHCVSAHPLINFLFAHPLLPSLQSVSAYIPTGGEIYTLSGQAGQLLDGQRLLNTAPSIRFVLVVVAEAALKTTTALHTPP